MARTKEQKKEIMEKLRAIMDKAESLVFVSVHGLKVADATALRRELTKNGVGFFVAKKTLTERVLGDRKYSGSQPALSGEFGLAYGTDPIAPARGIYEFQKKLKDQVKIVGGVFEKRYLTMEEMTGIAAIPPRETLYSMLLNVINSPIQGLVVSLSEIGKKQPA